MPIQELAPEVVDQIAAGEVVERPAHLVKELVENSLDAGATEIEIEFDDGGRNVRVRDNGSGIAESELTLAVQRHATSKIVASADLWRLMTYGFRGEALATIGAVSRMSVVSRPKGQEYAALIHVEFGKSQSVLRRGGEYGTVVQVADLFENVPARLKFLKSAAAEGAQIKHMVRGLAMANPAVAFRLKQAGDLIAQWPAVNDFKERVGQVLGTEPLFAGSGQEASIAAEVVVAPPSERERSGRQIWIFVQGRLVEDRGLKAAVTEAYRHLLMHGQYPIAAVRVTLPPGEVDINIHPAKSAVKFQNPSQAFRAVTRAVRGVLEAAPWLAKVDKIPHKSVPPAHDDQAPLWSAPAVEEPRQYSLATGGADLERVQHAKPVVPNFAVSPTTAYWPQAARPAIEGAWSQLEVLGQAHLTYIVAQGRQGIILIDQHAAHERVVFERLMSQWRGDQIDVQPYLMPLQISLEAEQVEVMAPVLGELVRLGIEADVASPTAVVVRAAPALLKESALIQATQRLAEECVRQGGSFALERLIGDVCASLACHSVVRAGQPLGMEQMTSLLQQMDEFPLSSFCPHGRPVSVTLDWSRLEREFGRIV